MCPAVFSRGCFPWFYPWIFCLVLMLSWFAPCFTFAAFVPCYYLCLLPGFISPLLNQFHFIACLSLFTCLAFSSAFGPTAFHILDCATGTVASVVNVVCVQLIHPPTTPPYANYLTTISTQSELLLCSRHSYNCHYRDYFDAGIKDQPDHREPVLSTGPRLVRTKISTICWTINADSSIVSSSVALRYIWQCDKGV